MNKKVKKLSLSRETVRSLDRSFFAHVAGAATAFQTNCGTCTTPSYCQKCYLPPESYLTNCDTCFCEDW